MLIRSFAKIWKLLPPWARRRITRISQRKFTASVAGIITNENGEILLLNHALRPVSGWGLPGGFIEFGEQPEAAFRRELREETGIDLRDVSTYGCRTLRRHIEIIFIAKGVGKAKVQSREIIELGWFEIENIPKEMSLDQQFLIRKALLPAN
jgi:ADP-ribose pyrophosphatase YjhB (NUDIX family)